MFSFRAERQSRLTSTDSDVQLVSGSNSKLKIEEKNTKEQLSSVERELGVTRSRSQQLQGQANTLYMNLARLTKIDVRLPMELGDTVPEEDAETSTKCVVCEGTHDNHLMVLCDTCDNYYHISCVDPPLAKVPKKTVRWGW